MDKYELKAKRKEYRSLDMKEVLISILIELEQIRKEGIHTG